MSKDGTVMNKVVSYVKQLEPVQEQKDKLQLLALEKTEKIGKVASNIVSWLVVGIMFSLVYFWGMFALATELNRYGIRGFRAVFFGHFFIFLFLLIFRKRILQLPVFKKITDPATKAIIQIIDKYFDQ